jgi:hypothetical protein
MLTFSVLRAGIAMLLVLLTPNQTERVVFNGVDGWADRLDFSVVQQTSTFDRYDTERLRPFWAKPRQSFPTVEQDTPVLRAANNDDFPRQGEQPGQRHQSTPADQPALGSASVTDFVREMLRRRKMHYPSMPLMDLLHNTKLSLAM